VSEVEVDTGRDCCAFGRQFGSEHDAAVRELTVRGCAARYRVTKTAIEAHRQCLGLVKPFGPPKREEPEEPSVLPPPPSEPPKYRTAMADVELGKLHHKQAERAKRVEMIANLIELNQWKGRKTLLALQQKWGVSDPNVIHGYMREAEQALASDRGGVPFERQVSIRKVSQLRDAAEDKGDLKTAVVAQKHLDMITGVLAPPSVQVNQQVNILASPLFQKIWEEIADELEERYPKAYEAVAARLERLLHQAYGSRTTIDVEPERLEA
jgi:hypothetical protein